MKKENLKAYGQACGIWKNSALNGRSEQVKTELPRARSPQVQQVESYASVQLLASQAAQS